MVFYLRLDTATNKAPKPDGFAAAWLGRYVAGALNEST
jgi:hypothetical protein